MDGENISFIKDNFILGFLKSDMLFKNTFFYMLTSLSSAIIGFIFWVIAARFYLKEDIGIAIALISSMNLLLLVSRFGLDQSIIRYFPEKNKDSIFNTSVTVTTFFVFILGLIFILGIDLWSPELHIIKDYTKLYLFLLISGSLTYFTGISLVALRKPHHYFIQNIIVGFRIVLLIPLTFLGALGILTSVGLSNLLAIIFSLCILLKLGIRLGSFDLEFLRTTFNFSAANFIAGLLVSSPNMLLPLIILNILGPGETAHYYIAYTVAAWLFMIPDAFSTSLFVEGSHGAALVINAQKAIISSILLLIPFIIIVFLFGKYFLEIIGKGYSEGSTLLETMAISSLFFAVYQLFISIKKIEEDTNSLIILNAISFIILMSLSYFMILEFGIAGAGYARIATYVICSLAIMVYYKEKWIHYLKLNKSLLER